MMLLILCALVSWFLVFVFLNHWFQPSVHSSPVRNETKDGRLVILIAARNEQDNIQGLLWSIENQAWLPKDTEVYVADDHSEDQTSAIVKSLDGKFKKFNLKLMLFDQAVGKKAVLSELLKSIDSDTYFFTDADCELSPQTIPSMLSTIEKDQIEVVFGGVAFKGTGFMFDVLQAEQLNTQVVTQSFFNFGKPIMANAASMMIKDSIKETLIHVHHTSVASGDDTFFAQSLKPGSYSFVNQPDALVYTRTSKSIIEFINQRIRWASKSIVYPSILAKVFGAGILGFNLLWVILMFSLMFKGWWTWVLVFVVSKFGIEYPFHRKWLFQFNYSHKISSALILSTVHPIYVCFIGFMSVLGVGYTWKGREYRR